MLYYRDMLKQRLVSVAWILSLTVALLALIAWWQGLLVPFSRLTVYDIFPLFGMVAFSLMWTHYIVGGLRHYTDFDRTRLNAFYNSTAAVVLGALLLHPGLIIWQTWRDGIGLPINYVAPDLRLFVVLGVVGWLVFMLFEFKEVYGKRLWWHYIERANELAMIAILVHGFVLARDRLPGWYMLIWIFYGLTFAAAVAYDAAKRRNQTGSWL